MFEIGQIIPREHVDEYIRGLAEIDEDMLNMYTGIFSSYICKKVSLSDLDYSRIDRTKESDIIGKYSKDIGRMPPIVTSPSFEGKRIVYDGCHRCVALENLNISEVIALVPYEMIDGRLVSDIETNKPEIQNCKYGAECDKGKCCLSCEYNSDCGGICSHCHDLGTLYKIVGKNVSLFCNGVWG